MKQTPDDMAAYRLFWQFQPLRLSRDGNHWISARCGVAGGSPELRPILTREAGNRLYRLGLVNMGGYGFRRQEMYLRPFTYQDSRTAKTSGVTHRQRRRKVVEMRNIRRWRW